MNDRRADIILLLIGEKYLEEKHLTEMDPELGFEIAEALRLKRQQLRETRPPLDRFFISAGGVRIRSL